MKSQTESYRPTHSGLQSKTTNVRMEPEPEVYYVDELSYQNLVKIYSEAFEFFQKIAGGYATLNIGTLTADVLRKLSVNDFSEVEKNVYADISKNIERLGISNELIKANMRKGADQPYLKFKQQSTLDLLMIGRLRESHPEIEINTDMYSLKDGTLCFTDADKSKLKEKYSTIRLDSQVKREFLKLTETTLENLQSLKAILHKNGIKSLFGENNLFSDTDAGVILNKSIMKYIKK